jgi:exonuclease SbcD
VDASVFDAFDYVALGHIHGAQNVGTERIRYCGTPLKYSFSEATQEKSVTVVTLNGKGDLGIRTIPLVPKHDLRELRGTYMELTARQNYEGTKTDDYLRITLTDEEDVPNAIGILRLIYPNLMKLLYDNRRTRANEQISGAEEAENKSPVDLFAELYEKQNGQPMSDEQREYAEKLTEKILEEYR